MSEEGSYLRIAPEQSAENPSGTETERGQIRRGRYPSGNQGTSSTKTFGTSTPLEAGQGELHPERTDQGASRLSPFPTLRTVRQGGSMRAPTPELEMTKELGRFVMDRRLRASILPNWLQTACVSSSRTGSPDCGANLEVPGGSYVFSPATSRPALGTTWRSRPV